MAARLIGPTKWSMTQDNKTNRKYTLRMLVETLSTEGPNTALHAPGMPGIGSSWSFDSDFDGWAFYTGEANVEPRVEREPNTYWDIDLVFSTDIKQCQEVEQENPLLQPQRVSGTFNRFVKEALYDRFGNFLRYSSWERIQGPQVEFDASRPTIRIEQNVSNLQLTTLATMIDTVNSVPQWGFPARYIKLSSVSWEEKFYGLCFKYYTRTLEFEVNYETYDQIIVDQGSRVLNGKWNDSGHWELVNIPDGGPFGITPNYLNPSHFMRAVDRYGQQTTMILNGFGEPYDPDESGTGGGSTQGFIIVQYYPESNFFLLGIPSFVG